MKITRAEAPEALARPGCASAIRVQGPARLAWLSSKKPLDGAGRCVAPGNLKAQYEYIMDQIEGHLARLGASWKNVVAERTYVSAMDDFRAFQASAERKEYYDHPPCQTVIGVPRLSDPEAKIEIEIIVVMDVDAHLHPQEQAMMELTRFGDASIGREAEFCGAVVAGGSMRICYFSGQTPQSDDMGCIAPGDLVAQYNFVMDKILVQLKAIGADWSNVVHRRVYLTDWEAWDRVKGGLPRYFDEGQMPASTEIGISRLSHPDFMIEIDIVAVVPA